jgi:hypothetical protein
MRFAALHIGLSALSDVRIEKEIVSEPRKPMQCVAADSCRAAQ